MMSSPKMKRHLQRRRAKKLLLTAYYRYLKVKDRLSAPVQNEIRNQLLKLQTAVMEKDAAQSESLATSVHALYLHHLKKSRFQQVRDFIVGIAVALFVAILIRQMWFELYEIPTGSMRPTFKEQDRLSVSKTDFGVNYPLTPGHFYFDPALIKRNNTFIFTTENMDFADADTIYFYLFPGKKLLVKRLIGKPGDTLYFYGGLIYGIDEQGNDISPELQLKELSKIDHIPFISFEGTHPVTTASVIPGVYSPVMIYQMNEPIARLYAESSTIARGELLPRIAKNNPGLRYSQIWGIGNYATARLLTKEQVRTLTDQDPSHMEEGTLYLELRHHPSLSGAKMGYDEMRRLRPQLGLSTSIIPLQEHHLKTLLQNLYTARFIADKGFAYRYGINPKKYANKTFFPHLPGIPDGTYEFYYGKAYSVGWQGITRELPLSNPLYRFDVQRIQLFFNVGMEFDTRYNPQGKDQSSFPSRYAYFRDGDLYLMGAPALTKDDPTLVRFIEREQKRQAMSRAPYLPFTDPGPPLLADGSLDVEKVKKYGITVPPASYLGLGDNHANSGDSRQFGFIPQANLRGGPSLIFWPPGSRFGAPNQPGYPFINPGRLVIWALAAAGFTIWGIVHRRRTRLPLRYL
jgi:signal peptidase I